MNALSDPRVAPAWTIFFAAVFLGGGAAMSQQRLKTVSYERGNNDIAQSRVASCRVLAKGSSVILGGYYFQPTAQVEGRLTGDLLPEGVYICDFFGGTARIERGGFAQFVMMGDAAELNKVLQQRISDPANPDSNEASRPRLDAGRPVYKSQPAPRPKDQLFNLQ